MVFKDDNLVNSTLQWPQVIVVMITWIFISIHRDTQDHPISKGCDSPLARRVAYHSSALQWWGPFVSKKTLHTASEWRDLDNRGRGEGPVTVTAMGSVSVITLEGSLDTGSKSIVLSSQLHLRAAEPLFRLQFPAYYKEGNSVQFQLISHFHSTSRW